MSNTYAYLRVSTLIQDTEKNKGDILRFANLKELGNVKFIEETVTGTSNYKDRLLGSLICDLKSGDVLIVPELSRLARSISQILEIIDLSKQKNFTLYSLKENFCSDDKSITSVITSTIFGLVAQIERDLISQRTKEALRAKKESGMMLGRPKGKGKSKLDIHKEEIEAMIKTGVPKTKIAKKYGTLPYNLYNWLKMNDIEYK